MKWLENNTEEYFYVNIGDFLTNRGIAMSDITEAKFLIKKAKNDDDADAVVDLRIGSGIADLTTSTTRLALYFSETDFAEDKLTTGQSYKLGVAIKTATTSNFIEMVIKESLVITKSFFEVL